MAVKRSAAADRDAILGAHAWAYMRYDPDYRRAWAAHAGLPRFEEAGFPVRVQTEADLLAEADWELLAWEDPGARAWRSPFWSGVPMLVGEPDPEPWPDPAPLLGLLVEAGARVEGLRLLDGRFVLKAELGNALLQIMVPSGRGVRARRRDHGEARAEPAAGGGGRSVRGPVAGCGAFAPSSEAPGPGKEDKELLKVLDALDAEKSVRNVALDVLEADGTLTWDPNGGDRAKARRRIDKATGLRDGGYRAFLQPCPKRRRRCKPDPGTAPGQAADPA